MYSLNKLTNVLQVTPRQIAIRLQHQGHNTGGQRSRRRSAGVRHGARVMQVGRHNLPFVRAARTVRGRQRRTALLRIPRHQSSFGGARYRQRPNGVGVTITIAIVLLAATVARRPNKDAALASSPLRHALDKRSRRHVAWAVHRFSIVIRTPRRTVDVNMLRIQAQRTRLHGVRHVAVQHANATDAGAVRNADGAQRIVGRGRHLARTSGAMPVRVGHVVVRHRVFVVAVDVVRGAGILFRIECRFVKWCILDMVFD